MKVSSHKYFEDKGVALSSLIKKQSTKAQLDFCLVLTSPFEVNTLRPKDCTTLKYGGNIYCLLHKVWCHGSLTQTQTASVDHSVISSATTFRRMFTFPAEMRDYVMTKCETKVTLMLWQHHHYLLLSRLPHNVWITRLHFLLMNGGKMQLKNEGNHSAWYI